jgi:ectoine hydroxylase-related dioxygenase (phytanoyl-CoA dioxygenase family)
MMKWHKSPAKKFRTEPRDDGSNWLPWFPLSKTVRKNKEIFAAIFLLIQQRRRSTLRHFTNGGKTL